MMLAPAAHAAPDASITVPNDTSCSEWSTTTPDQRQVQNMILWFAVGVITERLPALGYSDEQAGQVTVVEVYSWLDDYCKNHSDAAIGDAIRAFDPMAASKMVEELRKRSGNGP